MNESPRVSDDMLCDDAIAREPGLDEWTSVEVHERSACAEICAYVFAQLE